MAKKITAKTRQRAHELRHEPTTGEVKLWSRLRGHRLNVVHYRRQHPIGKYIVDICAPREMLIIEVDGSQHMETVEKDAERTRYLEVKGYKVLRFWNDDVIYHIEDVIVEIDKAVYD